MSILKHNLFPISQIPLEMEQLTNFQIKKWHSMQFDIASSFHRLYTLIKDFIKKTSEYIKIQVNPK